MERNCPKVTCDIIIQLVGRSKPTIVLIERRNNPEGLALPGGFVDYGERCIEAAAREAKEETGLNVSSLEQFYTYTDPQRDPRMHGITVVYIGNAIGFPEGGDDAKRAFEVAIDDIDNCVDSLCFRHDMILADYINYVKTGVRPSRE